MDGKLHVYRREGSRFWQCSTYLGSRNHRETTKETNLSLALEFAKQWFLEQLVTERNRRRGRVSPLLDGPLQFVAAEPRVADKRRREAQSGGPTFKEACNAFTREFEIITLGERNPDYVAQKTMHIDVHLIPFFGADTPIRDIGPGRIQEYRVHRQTSRLDPKTGKAKKPARATLHGKPSLYGRC